MNFFSSKKDSSSYFKYVIKQGGGGVLSSAKKSDKVTKNKKNLGKCLSFSGKVSDAYFHTCPVSHPITKYDLVLWV